MIGTAGARARMAFETAIAEGSCGSAHDGDPDGFNASLIDASQGGRDEVPIDVAVENRGAVPALAARRTDSAPRAESARAACP